MMSNRMVNFYERQIESYKTKPYTQEVTCPRFQGAPGNLKISEVVLDACFKYDNDPNLLIIGAIYTLMRDYEGATGITTVWSARMHRDSRSLGQHHYASCVRSICYAMGESVLTDAPSNLDIFLQYTGGTASIQRTIKVSADAPEEAILEIKTLLEQGVCARNLHPEDNFPKIVKAIVNQTVGMASWEWNELVQRKLSRFEVEYDVSACCTMS